MPQKLWVLWIIASNYEAINHPQSPNLPINHPFLVNLGMVDRWILHQQFFSLLLHVSSSAFSPISGARRLISSILEDVAQRHPTSAGNPWDGVTEVWLKSYGISAFIGVWCINGQFSTVQSPEGPYGFLSIFNLHFIWEMIFGTEHCKVFTPIPSQCQTPPNEILI